MSMRKLFYLFLCLFVSIGFAAAQTLQVTGTVISKEDGEPIMGASIIVKERRTIGAVTDIDGNFSINVPENAMTLQVSYVGMTPIEIQATPQKHMTITLHSSLQLEEVVVTAMGISREKKALGYAVQDVKSEELTMAANTSIADALQGKVSGVEIMHSSGMPGASTKMTIRGSRSFTGDNTPLYVVDGMPIASSYDVTTGYSVSGADYSNRSLDIDPNDIESVNVLKGQAASALYGMRASNGVIVITTKSGKGARKGKPEITFNTNFALEAISKKPELQTKYAQGSADAYNPNASTSWGPLISELPKDPAYGGDTNNSYTQADGMHSGQYYVLQRAKAGLDPWVTPAVYNNVDDFFRNGTTWTNNLNISQGFDKGNYAFSIGNMTSEGIVPSAAYNRYTVKMSAEAALSHHWKTGFSGNFITSKTDKQTGANNGVVATVYPAPPSYDLAGIPSNIEGDPYTQNTYRATSSFDAAYWAIKNNKFQERQQRFFGNVYAQYTTKMGTDNQTLSIKYQLGDDAYTTNYVDLFGYGHANGLGLINDHSYIVNEMNSLLTANYDWNITPDLNFNALVGNEYIDQSRKYNETEGINFNFAGWNHMQNISTYKGYEEYTKKRTFGLFGQLSLAYKNMLYFSATGRGDRVSNMPRGNRTFFYPSVSLGFIFTELEGVKNDILTYGKLRASYAEVGQPADAYYESYYSTPTYGGGFSSGTPIIYPIGGITAYTPYYRIYDPNLKPQNTKSYEIGADLNFLNGLFSLNYTYSRQNVKDQIFDVPLATSTGYDQLRTNGGSMHTNAHEVTLGVNPINNRNFKWDFAFNFSKIDNYVDELAEGVESIMIGGFVEPQVRVGIGDKYPVIYGVSYLRNDEGKIVVGSDGRPLAGEEKVIGSVSPDFRLGFNTSFEFFKVRLAAVFEWKQGGDMYAATPAMLDYYGVSKKSGEYRDNGWFVVKDAVKQIGVDANDNPIYAENDIKIAPTRAEANKYKEEHPDEPRPATAQDYFSALNNISESIVVENSFIKLREISLSYPVYNSQTINVTVNAFARNLILWSTIKGMDPETAQGNNNMAGAFERFSLPGTSSFGLGATVKF